MASLRAMLLMAGAALALGGAPHAVAATASDKPEPAKTAAKKPAADKAAAAKAGKDAPGKDASGKDAPADESAPAPARAPAAFAPNPALKDWLAKAGTDSFFLVLDPAGGTLQLVLGGVIMRTFPVSEVKVATPRRWGAAARLPKDWHERVWTGARIDPPHPGARMEIVGPEVGAASGEVLVPPTPEEAIPVPSLYRVRFREGLALEVTGGQAEQKGELPPSELPAGLREKWRLLRQGAPDLIRVRLRLTPEHYAEMYRSLPPGTDFVVLHGGD
ncbi:hypothetical protein FJ250_03120 [bacterium]|nr:hypothetical protein [bacterium]